MKLAKRLEEFIRMEALAGLILMGVLLCALVLANTGLFHYYDALQDLPVQIRLGTLNLEKPLLLWVNDGLMAVFFLLLALEIKREVLAGDLAEIDKLALPVCAALGGIVIPAAIYLLVTGGARATLHGWPIPTTTDIAFSLGVISLLGKRVPTSLRLFLVALSIVDDVIVIALVAILFTSGLNYWALAAGLVVMIGLIACNLSGVQKRSPYLLFGAIFWVCILESGIHATIAGVVLGLIIPLRKSDGSIEGSTLRRLEHDLHPWVTFFILPLFVFMNAGIPLVDGFHGLAAMAPIGVMLGLFVGKPVGVIVGTWLFVKLGSSKLPEGAHWRHLWGLACITGIGFTMSMFISGLAFQLDPIEESIRLAVLIGSALSIIAAVLLFRGQQVNEGAV